MVLLPTDQSSQEDAVELYRCSECGKTSVSLGWIHAHIEKHRGYTRFNIQIPFTKTSMANVDELEKLTEEYEIPEEELVKYAK